MSAQQVLLQVDTPRLLIGDRRVMYLELRAPQDWRLQNDGTSVLDSLVWLDQQSKSKWDTLENGLVISKYIRFTVFDSGSFVLPELHPEWRDAKGGLRTASTEPIFIEVRYPPTDSTLAPIKDIVLEPHHWTDYLRYVWAFLIIAVLSYIVFRVWQYQKQNSLSPTAAQTLVPPYEQALSAIEALRLTPTVQPEDGVLFQTRLSYIIRQFLNAQFDFEALEASTEDIARRTNNLPLSPQQSKALVAILSIADEVKFAQSELTPDQHLAQIERTKAWLAVLQPMLEPLAADKSQNA